MDGSKRTNDIKSLHSQWHHGLTHVNWQTTNNIATWLTNQVNIICKGYRPEARGYVIYSTRALPDGANFLGWVDLIRYGAPQTRAFGAQGAPL